MARLFPSFSLRPSLTHLRDLLYNFVCNIFLENKNKKCALHETTILKDFTLDTTLSTTPLFLYGDEHNTSCFYRVIFILDWVDNYLKQIIIIVITE